MNVRLNRITGVDDAIVSMFVSKGHLTSALEDEIRMACCDVMNAEGKMHIAGFKGQRFKKEAERLSESFSEYRNFFQWMEKLTKYGAEHTTLLRYIDFSFTVRGLHRAGQDDWDSHAKRFCNRIVRQSTRLSEFTEDTSEWYSGKIIPTDKATRELGIELPERYERDGKVFVKGVNGYIREDLKDDQDVKRGLYMLSIPSTFTFKCDLTEWAHIYKMRGEAGHAHPEVKQLCELCCDEIESFIPMLNRELFERIKN